MKDKKNISGLNAPEGYFENFEDRMMLKVMEDSLPASNGLKVPEGYFDSVEDKVLNSLAENEDPKVISLFSRRNFLYAAGIAASLVLIISLWGGAGEDINLTDINVNEVEAFIDEGGLEINTYDVLALLEEEDLSEITLPMEEISEENLEKYLLDNFDENSLLVE
ncbi:twin-arginine translocation signal domain-containing protein [Aureitalea sp. L0-47]|uniref:twin-arginine translocation signal domain-containing protein n=1 Tax=Aureitalea sp. L0-47 TaxID=2816962 RepID=UPI0022375899|nr:twin-arginine translocation signal domain-containing protein [Aureitalea sp. L0-47]MCW5519730.1 twin-arginine translocation signal domain-containing protein [Aureitalea sp. L0-47]